MPNIHHRDKSNKNLLHIERVKLISNCLPFAKFLCLIFLVDNSAKSSMLCSMDNTKSTFTDCFQVCQFTVRYLRYFFLEASEHLAIHYYIWLVGAWCRWEDNWSAVYRSCLHKTVCRCLQSSIVPFIDCATNSHITSSISFLLMFRSNYGPILYHFRDGARYWLKITVSSQPICI